MAARARLRKVTLMALVAAPLATQPATALASAAIRCVQAELVALDHDPGPVDGAFGRKTSAAFSALAEGAGGTFPQLLDNPLSADNSAAWCAELPELFPQARAAYEEHRPALEQENKASGLQFDVAADVPPARVEEIQEGFRIVRAFLDESLDGDIPEKVRNTLTVKIVATGRGNDSPEGGGGVATAFARGYPLARPFFDVAHPEWSQNTRGRGWTTATDNMKAAAHEYTHVWQASLGGISLYKQELGDWMNEGLAEYIAYRAMAEAGLVQWPDVVAFMARGAMGDETAHPLKAFGATGSPAWAGHVGFLAVDWLVSEAPGGLMALRTAATEVAKGRSQARAFRAAFGIELDDFYDQFEPWREALRKDPVAAIFNRPRLVVGPS